VRTSGRCLRFTCDSPSCDLEGDPRGNELLMIFSHPDCTVGPGISPGQSRFGASRGLSPPVRTCGIAALLLADTLPSSLSVCSFAVLLPLTLPRRSSPPLKIQPQPGAVKGD
jgi:hypothetical protein